MFTNNNVTFVERTMRRPTMNLVIFVVKFYVIIKAAASIEIGGVFWKHRL